MATKDKYENCRKKVYQYDAPWSVYSLAWAQSGVPTDLFRLAVGSYVEKYANNVHVVQLDPETNDFKLTSVIQHAYPTTQIQWSPKSVVCEGTDILATVGDYLRLWEVPTDLTDADGVISRPKHLFDSNKTKNACTPLTNMDWNETAKNIIGTCCIDPICTIWDIDAGKIKAKILAHGTGSSVFDLKFKPGAESIFGTVGADGSMRLFDLRNLTHSAIVYESKDSKPLLRLDWNPGSSEKIAVLDVDGHEVNIIDIRNPMKPVYKLKRHAYPVNAISWAPHSDIHIATAGEDSNAFIWNLESERFSESGDPLLEYCAAGCINNMLWSQSQPDWLSIAFEDKVQILLV